MHEAIRGHVGHHVRFYVAVLLGAAVWMASGGMKPTLRPVLAADAFFAAYLLSVAVFAIASTPDALRRRASIEDVGIALILLITLVAIASSFAAIFSILKRNASADALDLGFAAASVPLGWFTLHTVLALRYAHLFYARAAGDGSRRRDAGGLAFPGTTEPGLWDFVYFSFVLGTTAQVSDVQVLTTSMRRLTLAHGVASFFFNTVILALAVNVAAGLAG